MSSLRPVLAAGALAAVVLPAFAPAAGLQAEQGAVYPGAEYREEYIDAIGLHDPGVPADTTTTLHADVLRSSSVAWDVKQPVVLVVSPYTNHNDGGAGLFDGQGPNPRFYDFLEVTGALDRGYTFVQVDLPGFGGSGGCNDWGGPVEQRGVERAVEWAASQPWSTGKVALLGKSYDGWTGLMGMARDPEGLAAVVSMEPVYSGYRYLHDDGIRFSNAALTPAIFQVYDTQPGALNDDPEYHVSGAPQLYCLGPNYLQQQLDSEDDAFWAARDLVELAAGSDVPLFLTQGFLETNTKPDAAFAYFDAMTNPDNRAWFGQFDHVRGWEREGSGFAMGRSGFASELNRFLDQHLKGITPAVPDPAIAVQDNLGRYRAEAAWPPADVVLRRTELALGSYADGVGSTRSTQGIWSLSQAVPHQVWMAGEPVAQVTLSSDVPRTNLVVDLYDVDADGVATTISRGAVLVRDAGSSTHEVVMYGQDWMLPAGHRIAVRIVGANTDWWQHLSTRTSVDVTAASIELPLLTRARTTFLDGSATARLDQHLGQTFDVSGVAGTDVTFDLGGPLR